MRGRFLTSFLGTLTLLFAFLAWRAVMPFRESPWTFAALGIAFLTAYGSIIWMPLFFWSSTDPETRTWEIHIERLAHLSMGMLSLLLMVAVLRELFRLGFWIAGQAFPFDPRESAVVLLGSSSILFLIGAVLAWLGPKIRKVDLRAADPQDESPDSPPLRILQISDLHVGTWIGPRYVERLVRKIEAGGEFDLLVLTGDIGDGDVRVHAPSLEAFRRLQPRFGKFSVTGNHEGYWDAEGWNASLEALGFRVLRNEGVTIGDSKRRFTLHGIDDASPELAKALALKSSEVPSILLSHQPQHASAAARLGVDLVLVGHTHAGQFLPWSLLIGFFHTYAKGLYRVGKTAIYVNAGTGFWGPPLRLGTRSEITRLLF